MFDPTTVLLRFSENQKDFWTISDAMKGVSIIGGAGSGKTTASGKSIAKQYLKQGWGGLVLCAKTHEVEHWREYCKETGREGDLIVFSKGSKHKSGIYAGQEMVFNPFDYEMKRSGEGEGETRNIANILVDICRLGTRNASTGNTLDEGDLDSALKRCINRVLELLNFSGEDLTCENMIKIFYSSTHVNEEDYLGRLIEIKKANDYTVVDKIDNYCLQCLVKVYCMYITSDKSATPEELNLCSLVFDYFINILPNMSGRMKSLIEENFQGLVEPFLSGLLLNHFSGKTNLFPEWAYEQNKIIVLDFPVKEFPDSGIIAQCLLKWHFQKVIDRRKVTEFPTPVFLWAEEAQYFVNPYDQIFLTTTRSSRTATVFLFQNTNSIASLTGSGNQSQVKVECLLDNLSTKIFHSNSDARTNEYASRLIGDDFIELPPKTSSKPMFSFRFKGTQSIGGYLGRQILPKIFTMLRNGGIDNDFEVDSVIFISGKQWSTGTNFIKTIFKQTFKKL